MGLPQESRRIRVRVRPERLAFLKYVLEGCGHLALPVTLSGKEGLVELLVSPGEEGRWKALWEDLAPWVNGQPAETQTLPD
ncbi:DUF4911 domain-containing protein [Thermosulfurimonas marina]|uniref:DUF4911 domain-containing protein n=1 Tax=Thermosulfurimonas marina TaxID=2047767 RepID=A0A6H1WU25_9BACT|nr:DUF4911 domain-containing protein [Thermosulfurimonas marina]QJA06702.1 DUF4911 domain-containing protein [Thermosulfurimonas marina]